MLGRSIRLTSRYNVIECGHGCYSETVVRRSSQLVTLFYGLKN